MTQLTRNHRIGQGLVEFALVAPLFLFLVFGILESGRLLWTYHNMSNATKEGARYTTVRGSGSIQADAPASISTIKNHMINTSTGLNPDLLEVNMVLLDGDMQDRSRFRIESSYEFDFIVTSLIGIDGITIEATSTDIFWRDAAE